MTISCHTSLLYSRFMARFSEMIIVRFEASFAFTISGTGLVWNINSFYPKLLSHILSIFKRSKILSRDKTGLIRESMIFEKTVNSVSRISPPGCSLTHAALIALSFAALRFIA